MMSLLLIPFYAILNRFAGGGMLIGPLWNTGGIPKTMWNYEFFKDLLSKWGMDKLPGRAFYPAIILVLISALVFYSPTFAFLVAFTFGFWRTWAWGMFLGMGRHVPDRDFTWYEEFIFRITNGNYLIAFFIRHLFILPGFILFSFYLGSVLPILFGVVLAMLFSLSYELSWRIDKVKNPVGLAELLCGGLFGLTIVLLGAI